ncbi:MAG TPA: PASTA domain-containing protein [bacterium]|jgi:serine/threonine-protein kinase
MPSKNAGKLWSNRRLQIAVGVVAAFLLLYFLTDKIFMPLYTRQGSERPVPKLLGLTAGQARGVAQSVGFTIVEEPAKAGTGADPGTIIEQHPFAGAMAKPGRKIHIVPALEAMRGEVPDVVGLDLRDAQLRVRNVGLISGDTDVRYKFTDKTPKGTVVSQDPTPGKTAEPGTVVKITISMGPQPEHFFVPYMMEKPLADARTMLREAGLKMGKITRKETDQYASGTVIAQSLHSGDEVGRDTPVDIVVAVKPGTGPAPAASEAPPAPKPGKP